MKFDTIIVVLIQLAIILIIVLSINFFATPVFSGDARDEIKKISSLKGIENAQWGLSVKYVDSGKDLISLNENKNLIPASILKVFVTAAVLVNAAAVIK